MEPQEHPPTPPPEPEGLERFRQFVKRLMAVPYLEVQAELRREREQKTEHRKEEPKHPAE